MPIEIPMDSAAVRALVNHAKEVADLNAEANALMVEFIAEHKRMEQELREAHATAEELRGRITDLRALLQLLLETRDGGQHESAWAAVERELKRK